MGMDPKLPLTVITSNIRGLNPGNSYSKLEYMRDLASENNSVIISLTESHLSENISDEEVAINGWAHVRSDRLNRRGRGVIV